MYVGCCDDSSLLHHATDFTVRDGCFYLGDAGFALSTNILTPYRGHLRFLLIVSLSIVKECATI